MKKQRTVQTSGYIRTKSSDERRREQILTRQTAIFSTIMPTFAGNGTKTNYHIYYRCAVLRSHPAAHHHVAAHRQVDCPTSCLCNNDGNLSLRSLLRHPPFPHSGTHHCTALRPYHLFRSSGHGCGMVVITLSV